METKESNVCKILRETSVDHVSDLKELIFKFNNDQPIDNMNIYHNEARKSDLLNMVLHHSIRFGVKEFSEMYTTLPAQEDIYTEFIQTYTTLIFDESEFKSIDKLMTIAIKLAKFCISCKQDFFNIQRAYFDGLFELFTNHIEIVYERIDGSSSRRGISDKLQFIKDAINERKKLFFNVLVNRVARPALYSKIYDYSHWILFETLVFTYYIIREWNLNNQGYDVSFDDVSIINKKNKTRRAWYSNDTTYNVMYEIYWNYYHINSIKIDLNDIWMVIDKTTKKNEILDALKNLAANNFKDYHRWMEYYLSYAPPQKGGELK